MRIYKVHNSEKYRQNSCVNYKNGVEYSKFDNLFSNRTP